MEHLSVGIQLADENLANRPARFLSDAHMTRMHTIREKHDPDRVFHTWHSMPAAAPGSELPELAH
jgi:hypothetical protein